MLSASQQQLQPFTLTALQAGSTVTIQMGYSTNLTDLYYRTSKTDPWTLWTKETVITLSEAGDCVQFQNKKNVFSDISINKFILTGKIAASGNIMSLINYNQVNGQYACTDCCFSGIFHTQAALAEIDGLVLPATILAKDCYGTMFRGTSIITAPQLPATTLARDCYSYMFYQCKSLKTGPQLPATTLATKCYQNMFYYCTALTTAPQLPATTLADYCYSYMFSNCTALTKAPQLPATNLSWNCYQYMFYRCTSLTTAPQLPATNLPDSCYLSMFMQCSQLVDGPEIHATTFGINSLANMLSYCSRLASIKVHFTTWPSGALGNWVNFVNSRGTFYCPAQLPPIFGYSNIPQNYSIADRYFILADQNVSLTYFVGDNVNYGIGYRTNPYQQLTVNAQLVQGQLPAGFTLSTTGIITGTATTGGSFNLTVKLTAQNCQPVYVHVSLTIVALKLLQINNLTANDSNSEILVSQKSTSSLTPPWKAMDGRMGDSYSSASCYNQGEPWWQIEFLSQNSPIVGILVNFRTQNSTIVQLLGSNDGNQWTKIQQISSTPGKNSQTFVLLSQLDNYKYYRLFIPNAAAFSQTLMIYQIKFYTQG